MLALEGSDVFLRHCALAFGCHLVLNSSKLIDFLKQHLFKQNDHYKQCFAQINTTFQIRIQEPVNPEIKKFNQ